MDYRRGPFKLMVKSGETYSSSKSTGDPYESTDLTKRPRQIMVGNSCGLKMHAAVQPQILKRLNERLYSFIVGMNTTEICERFDKYTHPHWVSISIDGSSFDST